MVVGSRIRDVPPFKSGIVPSSDIDPGRDVEVIRQELEDYLKRLRDTLLQELNEIETRLAALEP